MITVSLAQVIIIYYITILRYTIIRDIFIEHSPHGTVGNETLPSITLTTLLSALGCSSIIRQSECWINASINWDAFTISTEGWDTQTPVLSETRLTMSKTEGGILWATGGDKKNGQLERSAKYLGNNCSSRPSGHFPELPRTQTLYRSHQWRIYVSPSNF